jgi:hypothetical protein
MNAIKMNRLQLLGLVQENKTKHIAEYLEAVEDYKKLVLEIAQGNAKLAKTGDVTQFKKMKGMPAAPNSYEKDYGRAIRMLELSVEEVIEVEEDIFNQLVLDEWHWKHSFSTSNSMYKAGASF